MLMEQYNFENDIDDITSGIVFTGLMLTRNNVMQTTLCPGQQGQQPRGSHLQLIEYVYYESGCLE